MPISRIQGRRLLFALAGLLLAACGADRSEDDARSGSSGGDANADGIWFEEEARERGIEFAHQTGYSGRYLYPEIACGGGALFDMDGDGDLDAYLVQSAGITTARSERAGNALFENDGEGRFTDVSAASGSDDRGYGMGVATGDYDGDGDVDLYVTNLEANVLYRNDGGGRFTDVTEESGTGEDMWSASAAFLDYDNDGDLDLWVVNYLFWSVEHERVCYSQRVGETYCGPKAYDNPAPDTLYRNEGDGTFTDVSIAAGLRETRGNGLGIGVSDIDADGFLDVFVANDGTLDHLWMNVDGERFVEKAVEYGCAADQDGKIKAGMGVALMDLDGDADEELLVVNLAGEYDSLFWNERTHMLDRTASFGLSRHSLGYTRFGVGFVDFDNDGSVDLYEANGAVAHGGETRDEGPFAQPNLVYRGTREGRFELVDPIGATAKPFVFTSRAALFGDVDGDGGVDVLVVNRDQPAHLFMNRVVDRGRWISLNVLTPDRDGERAALGALVSLKAGDRVLTRRVRSSTSYCAANDPRIHIGLGEVNEVREIRVRWIDGTEEVFGTRAAGREWTLVRGKGGG